MHSDFKKRFAKFQIRLYLEFCALILRHLQSCNVSGSIIHRLLFPNLLQSLYESLSIILNIEIKVGNIVTKLVVKCVKRLKVLCTCLYRASRSVISKFKDRSVRHKRSNITTGHVL